MSLIVWAKSRDSVHKPRLFFFKRRESRSGSNRSRAYQSSALQLGHSGSQVARQNQPICKRRMRHERMSGNEQQTTLRHDKLSRSLGFTPRHRVGRKRGRGWGESIDKETNRRERERPRTRRKRDQQKTRRRKIVGLYHITGLFSK